MPATDLLLDLPGDATPVAEAALLYARAGFAPVPIHGVSGTRCTCSDPTCSQAAGKHPVGAGWQKRASTDIEATRELFREHAGNIGIVLGPEFVVIDVDRYAGGDEGLATLPELPPTLTSRSGSGKGEHYVFRFQPGQDPAEVTNRKIATGVDVKTRSGQIVVAPSLHVSGSRYTWIDTTPPAPLPDALYEQIRKRRVVPIRPPARGPGRPSNLSRRAEAYVAKMPAAVSGSGGHDATFAVARVLWGFIVKGLPTSDARRILFDYNQRCDPPWSERELDHKWTSAEHAEHLPALEDRPGRGHAEGPPPGEPPEGAPPEPPEPDADDWRRLLLWDPSKSGAPKLAKHHENAVVVLRYHPRWRGRLFLDEHAQRVIVRDPPWHDSDAPGVVGRAAEAHEAPRDWTDSDTARLSSWLRREVMGLTLSVNDCDRAVTIAAEAAACHPFREFLDGLTWDGTPRLSTWLQLYMGVPFDAYSARVGTWWVISAVARTFKPGCQADYVLILEGPQGIRKSSALRTLVGSDWFSDTPIDIGNKDAFLAIQGKVAIELGELSSLKGSHYDRAKVFFSSRVDDYRAPYGRRNIKVPRSCVFAGTVNPEGVGYFRDPTGNRRYWPVLCGAIDLPGLAAAREQLWAEAVALYRRGDRWWPDSPEEQALCSSQQQERLEEDSWEDPVRSWCVGRDEITMTEVLQEALKLELGKHDRGAQMRVGTILRAIGYDRAQASAGSRFGKRTRIFRRLQAPDAS